MNKMFSTLTNKLMVELIRGASSRVCYVGPGISKATAQAIVSVYKTDIRNELSIVVAIDHSDFTIRSGFGNVDGVNVLREAGVPILHAKNYRLGVLIVNDVGYAFSPPPLCIEDDSEILTNAMRLSRDQINEVVVRFSSKEAHKAADACDSEEERKKILAKNDEVKLKDITEKEIDEVNKEIMRNPPVEFDISRKMNVFHSTLQYVEMQFNGARLEALTVPIPKEILAFGLSEEIKKNYRATFRLFDEGCITIQDTAQSLKEEYDRIREDYLTSLGPLHGNVIRKRDETEFKEKIKNLERSIEAKTRELQEIVDSEIKETVNKLVDYFLPIVKDNKSRMSDELRSRLRFEQEENFDSAIRFWIREKLAKKFPSAEKIFSKMSVKYVLKGLTYETLTDEEFQCQIANNPKLHDLFDSPIGQTLFSEQTTVETRRNS